MALRYNHPRKIARRTGVTIVACDEAGNAVAGESPPRRNEITVRPKTST